MSTFRLSSSAASFLTMMPSVLTSAPTAGTGNFFPSNVSASMFSPDFTSLAGNALTGAGLHKSLLASSKYAELRLMSGAMPSSMSELANCNPTTGNRTSDILLRVSMNAQSTVANTRAGFLIDKIATGVPEKTDFFNSVLDGGQYTIIRNNVGMPKFTVDGTISWFWWCSVPTTSASATSGNFTTPGTAVMTPLYQIFGSVSGPGGGGDIELSSTTATTGGTVSINFVKVAIPLDYEW